MRMLKELICATVGCTTGFILGMNGVYWYGWQFWVILLPVVILTRIVVELY